MVLKPGQLPAEGVLPGDHVAVLQFGDGDAAAAPAGPIGGRSMVVSAVRNNEADTGGTLLTLTVPADYAAQISFASFSGHLAVIRVSAA